MLFLFLFLVYVLVGSFIIALLVSIHGSLSSGTFYNAKDSDAMSLDERKIKLDFIYNEQRKVKTSHVAHFFVTLITGGLWIPCWVGASVSTSSKVSRFDEQINIFQR